MIRGLRPLVMGSQLECIRVWDLHSQTPVAEMCGEYINEVLCKVTPVGTPTRSVDTGSRTVVVCSARSDLVGVLAEMATNKVLCKVTPVILHGVVSPDVSPERSSPLPSGEITV